MKDFPMFTTEYGVASLVLREIPYRQTAYVTIQSSLDPEKLVGECVSFCRMCGAERIYATGHEYLADFPLHTVLLQMTCMRKELPHTDAVLRPVQSSDLEHWRGIYNERAAKVPNGAWMTYRDGEEMLAKGDGHFVFRGDVCIGIGRASGNCIDWVAATMRGCGRDVVLALSAALTEDTVELTVANNNPKAVRLYESLGFEYSKEISRWYTVYECVG